MSRVVTAVAESLEPRKLFSISLVKDINPGNLGSDPNNIAAAGAGVVFGAEQGSLAQSGRQVWTSNGSPGGTAQVPGLTMLSPPRTFAGEAYFIGSQSGINGLWKSDGTVAGTVPVGVELNPGAAGIVAAGNRFFFVASQESATVSLWSSDGTASGTERAFNLPANFGVDNFGGSGLTFDIAGNDAKACFVLRDNTATVSQVWASDGTPAGTHLLIDNVGKNQALVAAAPNGGFYIFVAGGPRQGLYKSDGTPGGTTLVSQVHGDPSFNNQLAVAGNKVFFTGRDDINGTQLWESDGTAAGTEIAFNIDPLNALQFDNFTAVNGVLIFDVVDAGWQGMWRSDGTAIGSGRLHQFVKPAGGWPAIAVVGNEAYFAADDGALGLQLWKTDGNSQNTQKVAAINPVGTSNPTNLTGAANQELFLSADDGVHGPELWKSNGTPAGTQLVKDIDTRPASSAPLDPIDVGGTLFFTATDQYGRQVWKSDGTAAGTVRVTALDPDETGQGGIQNLTNLNGTVYFTTGAGDLWKTDGTERGTSEVLAAYPNSGPTPISDLTAVGSELFFTAVHGSDVQLWRTDGSAAGTFSVASWPNEYALYAHATAELTPFHGGVVFQAISGDTPQLWRSDGTFAGTGPLTNIPAIPSNAQLATASLLGSSGVVGDMLYFVDSETMTVPGSTQAVTVHDLWKTDGTPAGTVKLAPNFPFSPLAFFDLGGVPEFFGSSGTTSALWALDATTGAASLVQHVPRAPAKTSMLGGKLYFFPGAALWVTDGTAAGTLLVAQLPFPLPNAVTTGDGQLFFNDFGLWRSDGSATGTAALPGSTFPSFPPAIMFSGNRLFFSANDPSVGTELFAADASVSGTVFDDLNKNGVRDAGEPGIAGVTVFLDANNNGVLDPGEPTTITDANGNFTFDGLAPGNYAVRQVLPTGYVQTTPLATMVSTNIGSNGVRDFGDVSAGSVPLDFNYLVLVARNYGRPGTFAVGDLNGDGLVNFDDLVIVARNYEKTIGGTNAAATLSADVVEQLPNRARARHRPTPPF